ncbi:dihydrofolate reductase family protein [Psychromicrobium sp. YIM B11713]|uniref:dihydrofolate reductase family protein n=1 Tax=Psychromicrobium sp. YIM B11713 TaxID=3145233 RepID=UPI00374FCD92
MRKLILKMSVSLDGFVSGPNGEVDWMFRGRSEDSTAWVLDTVRNAGLHALGSKTFRALADFWPTSTEPMAAPMNDIPKVIFTRQKSFDNNLEASSAGNWASARVANGDLTVEMNRLKEEPGNYILAQGGAGFARGLIQLGLVDEYRLVIHPVLLGSGIPIFSELQQPRYLNLISAPQFQSGLKAQVYRPENVSSL